MNPLRCVSYLAADPGEPGLPAALFASIAAHLETSLKRSVSFRVGRCGSGPIASADDPFARDEADLGWVCAPSMLWLVERGSVVFVPAAMTLDDPRYAGRPEYGSELVVRAGEVKSVEALRGAVAGYNDTASLSGWGALLDRVQALGGLSFFAATVPTGSHANSLRALREGRIDVAAIDTSVWRTADRTGLCSLEALGPYPIQPTVLRAGLAGELIESIAAALLRLPPTPPLAGFVSASFQAYVERTPWSVMRNASASATGG